MFGGLFIARLQESSFALLKRGSVFYGSCGFTSKPRRYAAQCDRTTSITLPLQDLPNRHVTYSLNNRPLYCCVCQLLRRPFLEPIACLARWHTRETQNCVDLRRREVWPRSTLRSEEHTSELQSLAY